MTSKLNVEEQPVTDRKRTAFSEEIPAIQITQTISIPLKYVCLFVLVGHISTLVLLMRNSRVAHKNAKPYLASTAVVCAEVIKLFICCCILIRSSLYDVPKFIAAIHSETIINWKEAIKLAVPAGLYTVQNNLLYVALSNLDSATYQITYQLKILTTALFSVVMLQKKLNSKKWVSLVILMAGVCLVQWPTTSEDEVEATKTTQMSSKVIGLMAVLASCMSSGFSGVYFEKLLKSSNISVWMRNFQLALFSIFLGILAMLFNDWSKLSEGGFFQGYDTITWVVILLQACGGLLVAVVVKYADNILKGFATSISIIVSSLVAYFFLGDFTPTWFFLIGASAVLFATYLYSLPASVNN